ncbi:MAG: PAS domain-containing sensor histidine kinase [Rhizobacter sp.]|nr:PAS domain-containing sensor histidine kinase [Rhizobacter sp.]
MGRRSLAHGRTQWMMVGPFLVVVALLATLAVVGVDLISAVRAYVGGESRWSKGQKDAVYHLERYIASRNPADYERFEEALAVPLGDREARQALEQAPPDLARVEQGLLAGGNHPDDIDGMVSLFLRFRRVSFMADAIAIWAEADTHIEELAALGRQLQARVVAGDESSDELRDLSARLPALNAQLTVLERRFSATLGEASRTARQLVLAITLVLTAAMTAAAALLTRALLRDQTRVEQDLREVNERWTLAADAAGLGLFDWDLRTQRTTVDARGAALYGLAPEAVEVASGTITQSRVHPDDAGRFRSAMASALASPTPAQLRYRICLDDGSVRHIEAVARVRDDGNGVGVRMVGTLRDVTAEVQAAQLQLEKDSAERASVAKSEFLSRVSHELRTPLNAVLGFAELLASDAAEPLTPAQAQRVQQVLAAGRRLLVLIDDILDLSHLDDAARPLTLRPLALAPVLQAALARVEPLAQAQPVRVSAELPPHALHVLADEQRLQQVLGHLLANAIQYNRPGGDVVLHCEQQGDEVGIELRDTGPGLRPDQLDKLFQPFNRLGAEFGKVPGSGLGLVIVQQLLKRMQGTLQVASTEGVGTCVTVRLKAAQAAQADQAHPPDQAAGT